MLTKKRLQELYGEMLVAHPKGLSSTSTTKFDGARKYLANELGISTDDIYLTGSGKRAGNLEVRLSQGQQANQHTKLGVAYLLDEIGSKENRTKLTNSAFSTAEKYVGASGKAEYDCILIIITQDKKLFPTGIMYIEDSPVAAAIMKALPGLITKSVVNASGNNSSSSATSGTTSKASSYGKISDSLQKIYYGAPGTGKSFTLHEDTKGEEVIRITFHPDCDYSSFVGTYKPVEIPVPKTLSVFDSKQNKAVEFPVMDSSGKQVSELKITYRFVQQDFLKAYIKAWKKLASLSPTNTSSLGTSNQLQFSVKKGELYTITSADSSQLTYIKELEADRAFFESAWNGFWSTGSFFIKKGARPGRSVQEAVASWINSSHPSKNGFQDGWTDLLNQCNKMGSIELPATNQSYIISAKDATHVLITSTATKSKERIKACFADENKRRGVEKGIIALLLKFNLSSFDEAWAQLETALSSSSTPIVPVMNPDIKKQYLIIEEINRGDCAQIFGDIFQLLDRNDQGFSTYPIEADSDIQRELKKSFAQVLIPKDVDELYKDDDGNLICFTWEDENGALRKGTISEAINDGAVLALPCNLYIYATMNTSDQSLFPMDSAFKRRWEWKYFSIMNEGKDYKIVVDDQHQYDWWETIKTLNEKIYRITKTADKQLGYWFAKLPKDSKVIGLDQFVSKVVFYLWNDVFKDYSLDSNNAFSPETQFEKFYKSNGDIDPGVVILFLENNSIHNEKQPLNPSTSDVAVALDQNNQQQ